MPHPGVLPLPAVPLAWLAAALVLPAVPPARRWRVAHGTALLAGALALASAVGLLVAGPAVARGPMIALGPFGTVAPSVRLDALTAVVLLLVTGIAAVILRYSERYLDGEPGAAAYLRWYLATIAAVSLLVVSNDLLVVALAWMAASLTLHQLLTFFADRPQAIIAAHKKFLLSRVADLGVLVGVGCIGWSLGTLEIDQVLVRVAALPAIPGTLAAGGVLLAAGIVLRSAQLPFHGWLIQVMEAPTPVSALLHAGIVNIGGFVMIRLAGLMPRLEAAQWVLVGAGTATAVLAALVMSTRVSVKVALAWSTAAQMGFMLLECGLGAYGLALLHLVAHSLYKAHAFLGSGGVVERTLRRGMAIATPAPRPNPVMWLVGAATGVGIVGLAGLALGVRPQTEPGLLAAGVILALALAPLFVRVSFGPAGWRSLASGVGLAAGLVALYAAGHLLFAGLVPAVPAAGGEALRAGAVVAAFLALYVVQAFVASRPEGRLARALYPACYAGFYLDEVFTRMTFRIWPPRALPVARADASVPLLRELAA